MAERLFRLHVHPDGLTPKSKFFGLCEEPVPVGSYHTLFCPVYVLDARSQNEGAIEPSKWNQDLEWHLSRIFSVPHGSVTLVLNPTTGLVPPQFNVVLDDNFSMVPFTMSGHVPDYWADLYCNSRELATEVTYDLAESWFRTQGEVPDFDAEMGNNVAVLSVNPFEEAQRPPNDGEQLLDNRTVRPSDLSW